MRHFKIHFVSLQLLGYCGGLADVRCSGKFIEEDAGRQLPETNRH